MSTPEKFELLNYLNPKDRRQAYGVYNLTFEATTGDNSDEDSGVNFDEEAKKSHIDALVASTKLHPSLVAVMVDTAIRDARQ